MDISVVLRRKLPKQICYRNSRLETLKIAFDFACVCVCECVCWCKVISSRISATTANSSQLEKTPAHALVLIKMYQARQSVNEDRRRTANEHFNFIWQLILLLQSPESKQYKELVQSRRCILRGLSLSLSITPLSLFVCLNWNGSSWHAIG